MHRPWTCVATALLAFAAAVANAREAEPPTQHSQDASSATPTQAADAQPPLRSQAQLDAWLAAHEGQSTPLDLLSPGARERFLLDLSWGESGLGGFGPADLVEELTDDQIASVLGLFGADIVRFAPSSLRTDGDGQEATEVPSDIGPFERRYNAYYSANVEAFGTTDHAGTALATRFDSAFPEVRDDEAMRALNPHDLRLLGRAIESVATVAGRTADIDAMQQLFAERERRGIVDRDDVGTLQRVLLVDHRFDAARTLATTHPEALLSALPDFVDPLSPTSPLQRTAWRMAADGETLTRTHIDLQPAQILVTSGCHFSRDAAEDISADPVLGPAFARHAHWLMLAPGVEDIDMVREWNADFPHAQAEMIYARDEWAVLPEWAQPTFYIVRVGRIVDRVKGWGGDPVEQRQALIDALERAGLLDGAAVRESLDNASSLVLSLSKDVRTRLDTAKADVGK